MYVIFNTRLPNGKLSRFEDEHTIAKFRRFLPDRGRKGGGLVQFYAVHGGQRTIDVGDIVDIR